MKEELFADVLSGFVVLAIVLAFAYGVNKAVDARSNGVRSVVAVSFDHDGHRWVRALRGGGLAHHPDCPCHANAERGAE